MGKEPMQEVEMVPVRVGSKEVYMPKNFRVSDLKEAAKISKDRSMILYRGGRVHNLPDKRRVEVEEDDYFKDLPPAEQGE